MSYDILLIDPSTDEVLETDTPHQGGGTTTLGGTTECSLNVTYNYAPHFYRLIDPESGIRWLYGKTAAETTDRLREAISQLDPGSIDSDYWNPSEGNARCALEHLLSFALAHPSGVWEGD